MKAFEALAIVMMVCGFAWFLITPWSLIVCAFGAVLGVYVGMVEHYKEYKA